MNWIETGFKATVVEGMFFFTMGRKWKRIWKCCTQPRTSIICSWVWTWRSSHERFAHCLALWLCQVFQVCRVLNAYCVLLPCLHMLSACKVLLLEFAFVCLFVFVVSALRVFWIDVLHILCFVIKCVQYCLLIHTLLHPHKHTHLHMETPLPQLQ